MNRTDGLNALETQNEPWDMLVVGGGATGLGCAVDAAARGYRTLLVEQADFAKGTSSRSTKLVHGGVRYLKQGNISLVLEALKERGLLSQNAPHLVRAQSFIVPAYSWWEGPFYGIGMKVYDGMAGRLGLKPSKMLSREKTLELIPTLEPEGLQGGVMYYDGQFDDARLAVNLAQTVVNLGGTVLNYARVTGLLKGSGLVTGVTLEDTETGTSCEVPARCIINATGVFSDGLRHMDDPEAPGVIAASQGVHLVLSKEFLPGDAAIMVPHTTDGRVLFAVPWHGYAVVGTTDTPRDQINLEPCALEEEIGFILNNAAQYLHHPPKREDILSVFAGLRPLVKAGDASNTAAISRDHTIMVSESGLLTITGGKWTTYRKMAQDAVDQATVLAGLTPVPCPTEELKIHGWAPTDDDPANLLALYGSDTAKVEFLATEDPALAAPIHPDLPYPKACVVFAARHEMARSVEDVLARRTRSLLLNARASIEAAGEVAALMAETLGKDETWAKQSADAFRKVARGYVV